MCLIALSLQAHPRYRFALAANRDEFHARATAPAAFWDDAPGVFGGRDLVAGGGWLALTRNARLAAVTNVRRMIPPDPRAPSRGQLVADFVRGDDSADDFIAALQARAERYAGFNLMLVDGDGAWFATNAPHWRAERLAPGIHAISNATLNTPWPKLRRIVDGVAAWNRRGDEDVAPLFTLLADDQPAADHELPDTGVGGVMERFLSPPFIRGDGYGTRASTVVLVGHDGQARFVERCFGPMGVAQGEGDQRFATAPAQR